MMAAAARVVTLVGTGAALAVLTWLGADEWPALAPMSAAAFVLAFAGVRLRPRVAWTLLLAPAYLTPVLFYATRGSYVAAYHAVWMAGLFGAILASSHPLRWHLPTPWRLPLVFWALINATAWPIIALREMNFTWASIGQYTLANSGLGGPPPVVIVGMLVSVLGQALGLLWFDAMFASFGKDDLPRFRRAIVAPLTVSLALGSLLAVYQLAFDINFLSAHQWPFYGRAAGGLLDGNAFGALAGLWSAASLALALVSGGLIFAGGLVVTLLFWIGLWATGSRMALLAGLLGLGLIGAAAVRGRRLTFSRGRLAAAAGALIVVVLIVGALGRSTMDPIARTLKSFDNPRRPTIAKILEFELWNRFGPFGTASVRMVSDSPLVGSGPGTFEVLFPDYAHLVTKGKTRSHFDNAQSWYRHRLAELGVIGSLGWMTWLVVFGVFVWRAAPSRAGLTEATGVKAAIIALAIISMVSMPTRNAYVSLTFWVFAFWLTRLHGDPWRPAWLAAAAHRRVAWAAVWGVTVLFAAGTAWTGYTALRPPYRAMMADWDYVNGVSRPVRTPDGRQRFARAHGVAVFRARPGYLKLVFQLPHEDAAATPVRVRIFERDTQVASLLVGDRDRHELYIPVAPRARRMMIQTWVDREAPAAGGLPARGLILDRWTFVAEPPQGAMIAGPGAVPR
jgi:hypothetical protein